jgi:hypothetical protein
MNKFLTGLLMVVLIAFVVILASALFQQGQTVQVVAQTAQSQAETFRWQAYNQTLQTLYAILSLLCGGLAIGLIAAIVGVVIYRINRTCQQRQAQQGAWVSGTHAYWGRVGDGRQPRPAMQAPYAPYASS